LIEPYISDYNPKSMSTEGGIITFYGTNLGNNKDVISVTIGGKPCNSVRILMLDLSAC
jgi:hypothetical protein